MKRPRNFRQGAWRLAGAAAAVLVFTGFTRATRTLAVTSVVLSPTEVKPGTGSQGTVTLNEPTTSATIQLSSRNTAVATVPSTTRILTTAARPTNQATFSVQTTGAFGCAEITARIGTTTARKALITVPPPAQPAGMRLTLGRACVLGGQGTTGTVTLIGVPVTRVADGFHSCVGDPQAAHRVPAALRRLARLEVPFDHAFFCQPVQRSVQRAARHAAVGVRFEVFANPVRVCLALLPQDGEQDEHFELTESAFAHAVRPPDRGLLFILRTANTTRKEGEAGRPAGGRYA